MTTQPSDQLPMKSFTLSSGLGLTYDTPDEMATYLFKYPQETAAYSASVYNLANIFGNMGDYRGMRECLNFMVDVFVTLAKLRGDKYLE